MRFVCFFLVCVLAVSASISCDADKTTPTQQQPPQTGFKDLQDKDDVLYNLELAYNESRYDQYDKLLDESFTFIVSEADFNDGVIDVPQWDRDREVRANTLILNPNNPDVPLDLVVINIDLHFDYQEGNWREETENETHPGESWYKNIVVYDLVVKTQDGWEHRALGLQAEFTIRWASYDGGEHWRIVLWRDEVETAIARSTGATAIEETTWGGIKAMYSD